MPSAPTPATPSPAVLAWYNAVPNVFWSVLGLAPVSVYCYQYMERPWLYGMLALSLLAYAVPISWFHYWQLSPRPAAYRRLGVPLVSRLTQHGALIHGLLRRQYPQYRRVRSRAALAAVLRATYHQERFHLVLLLFFLLTSLYAAALGHGRWALVIGLANVGYNLYPMWLQQYLRVRLAARG